MLEYSHIFYERNMESDIALILTSIVIVLLVALVSFLLVSKGKAPWKEGIRKALKELSPMITSNDTIHQKAALIEVDKLLDTAFKHKSIPGDTMGERLKAAKKLYDYKTYDTIWEAHKERNRLVHEMNYTLPPKKATKHFKALSKGISSIL